MLKVYGKQLSQEPSEEEADAEGPASRMRVSAEGKREAVIHRVTSEIVRKIKEYASPEMAGDDALNILESPPAQPVNGNREGHGFTFNAIGADSVKTTRTLSLEDSDFFIRRLGELANASAAKKTGA